LHERKGKLLEQHVRMKVFPIETQPVEDRIIRFYRKKLHNEDPPHFKIMRKQFPVRLTYSMTINKAQGNHLHNFASSFIFLMRPNSEKSWLVLEE